MHDLQHHMVKTPERVAACFKLTLRLFFLHSLGSCKYMYYTKYMGLSLKRLPIAYQGDGNLGGLEFTYTIIFLSTIGVVSRDFAYQALLMQC